MGETYYEVLWVGPDASQDEITAAYRERVLEIHPDHNDDPDAAEQFASVSEAESVLSDGAERARYDRLGHDTYVRLSKMGTADASNSRSEPSSRSDSTSSDASDAASSGSSRDASRSGTNRNAKTGTQSPSGSETGRARDRRGRRSHHARHRRRRQRTTESRTGSGRWPFGGPESSTVGGPETDGSSRSDTGTDGNDSFRYAVHDWTGEIDLEGYSRRLDRTTAVTVGCVAAAYPTLVYASLTAAFPLFVNAIVAVCALLLAGYLLTMPTIAVAVFGGSSTLVTVAVVASLLDPFSVVGALAVAFFWVPFGYALTVWWVLRP
ncbi:J domain-containing protein [Natrialbaceae archaeon GCM10025810]|uniref:J domain-containing protein n=1 Tax=Halovalidus salilacus TaxID=3075124 RepID=UPI0036228FF3